MLVPVPQPAAHGHESDELTTPEPRGCPRRDGLLNGGADLAVTFIRLDLIHRYWLFVNPDALGAGSPLFTDFDRPLNSRSPRSGPSTTRWSSLLGSVRNT
jgi:dihydrofolate reductase